MINCNSIAYRILYSDNQKSRDLIMGILSFCPEFSLADIFITQADVLSALMKPSGMMMQAFKDIMKQTEWTKQCLTLNLEPESKGL